MNTKNIKIAITTINHVTSFAGEIIDYFGTNDYELYFTSKRVTPEIAQIFWCFRKLHALKCFNTRVTSSLIPMLSRGIGSGYYGQYGAHILIVLPYSTPYEFVQRLIADGFYTWREEGVVRISGIKPTTTDRMLRPFVDHRGVRISNETPVLYGFSGDKPSTMYFAPAPDFVMNGLQSR